MDVRAEALSSFPDRYSDMRTTIEHFMWGYQELFRHSLEMEAGRVLESLKPGLNARVFLVGVRFQRAEDGYPACVEPEIHHWANSSDFYDVLEDVDAIQESYPESQISHSHPVAQTRMTNNLSRRALRDAVIRRLEATPSLPEDTRIFASFPVEREDFLLMTIITVTKSVFDEIPMVGSEIIHIHEYRSFRVPCSLAEAAIEQIFAKSNGAITQRDAGSDLWVLGSADQILRDAGAHFFAGLLQRVDQDSLMAGMAAEVFDIVSRLSLAPYEKAEAEGCLVFADKTADFGTPVLKLAVPLPLRESRALRKLLELTNEEVVLHCNCQSAFALVRASGESPQGKPAAIAVSVLSRGRWVVSHGDTDLMILSDGLPSLPQPIVDESDVSRNLRRILPSMTEAAALIFATIASRLATSGHGSIVVVSEAAPDEAVRLGRDSLPISPLGLTPDLAARLSRIDGALLCDPAANCHAVGVILDGHATTSGDRGRGSRFNSAVRYIASSGSPTAAMVVSDDGGLDLLPRLRSTLSNKELLAKLDELRQLARMPSNPPDHDREFEITRWIERHAYYLDETQCDSVNEWIAVCRERATRGSAVQVSPRILKRDPSFDPDRDLV